MAGLKWREPPEKVWPAGADAYVRAVRAGVHGVMQYYQPIVSNEMKQERPWTDRSSNAIQGLYTAVEPPTPTQGGDTFEFIMSHGVEYGIWLELANNSRYNIVIRTLDKYSPIIWRDIRSLFR